MKIKVSFFLLALVLFFSFIFLSFLGNAQTDTDSLWKKVELAEKENLPKTAIDQLNKIYSITLRQKRYGEALKAVTKRITFEAYIKGEKPEVLVKLLKEEIEKAPRQMQPLLKTVLANWYWEYYLDNRYQFLKRSKTEGLSEDDFTTWDLSKLYSEISSLYQDILKEDIQLKKIKIDEFLDFLRVGSLPVKLRPTLFDFVAFKALEFYSSPEQVEFLPEDAFQIDAQSGAFEKAYEFIKYKPDTTDTDSAKYMALIIFQEILKFHINDKDMDASLDADINRLNFVYNNSFGEGKEEIYIKRLKEITKSYPESEIVCLAYYYWAKVIYNNGDYVRAYRIAKEGEKLHPKSPGGMSCSSLISKITAKEIEIKNEGIAPQGDKFKTIAINYRNINAVTFRILKDSKNYAESGYNTGSLTEDDIKYFLSKKPLKEWTVSLAPAKDFKTKKTSIVLPQLEKGFYRIFASYKKDFSNKDNSIKYSHVWISNIAVVTRIINAELSGFVLESSSGEPVEGATVKIYGIVDKKAWKYGLIETFKTNKDGYFVYRTKDQDSEIRVYANDNNGSEFLSLDSRYLYKHYEEKSDLKEVVFFTDRAIYRPGQTVYFKGICIEADKKKNKYKVIPDLPVTVYFYDANNQEVSKLKLKSGDFGSFSGSFTAPAGTLTGAMTLKTDSLDGYASIRVEEYKRPKFTVQLDTPDTAFKLEDDITLTGKALSYTGASIDNAKVTYRVVRQVSYPYWCFWRMPDSEGSSQEIAHGATFTNIDGTFAVSFNAKPDKSASKELSPYFVFTVYADITDSTGETISTNAEVKIGYAAMEAGMTNENFPLQGEPVKINIYTSTLDGKPLPAEGAVEVFELKEPLKPVREEITEDHWNEKNIFEDETNTSKWELWPAGEMVGKFSFKTDKNGIDTQKIKLDAGSYKIILKSKDKYGNPVKSVLPLIVINQDAEKFNVNIPYYYRSLSNVVETGSKFSAFWGTGYDTGRAFVEIMHNGKCIKKYWTEKSRTQDRITVPVGEELRGGFWVLITFVKENRLYTDTIRVDVPWSNKKLDIEFLTFRSKLEPGQKETWTVKIKGPGAEKIAAEFVAAMYDESLDAFISHNWPGLQSIFKQDFLNASMSFSNKGLQFNGWISSWNSHISLPPLKYIDFPGYISTGFSRYKRYYTDGEAAPKAMMKEETATGGEKDSASSVEKKAKVSEKEKIDLSKVTARKILNETAFFLPSLITDKDGTVNIIFKMPEDLTKWHFMGFAHTKDLKSGYIDAHAVTQKDLMVQPNPPRFLRENDELVFSVKVTNMLDKEVKGKVRLTFFDPETEKEIDALLGNINTDKEITIPAKQSRGYNWRIKVPGSLNIVAFKAVASCGGKQDGEEGLIPVLSSRIFVTESMPLWVRGPGQESFTFKKLLEASESKTIVNKRFVVQVSSNPAWYAVQALPFLMEFPYECSEQTFNRLYANSIAGFVANSDPKIKKVFGEWKGTDALASALEKNKDLKNCLLEESPWVLDAQDESQAKKNIGIFFDQKRLDIEIKNAMEKLRDMQLDDGSFSWFPGGRGSSYITLYIMTGFGKLNQIGVKAVDYDIALKAVDYTDSWINTVYEDILKNKRKNKNNLSSAIAFYLYGRSFYHKDNPVSKEHNEAVNYFLQQAKKHWTSLDSLMSQAHLAIALKRFGEVDTPKKIMASLKERSQSDKEMGMFWEENSPSWWWYRFPVETQSVLIAAFDEVANDSKSVEDCKIWLLKQKQTTNWKTTTATADAVYALICRGENLLASDEVTEIVVGSLKVDPEVKEAGTGFYEKIFDGKLVKPDFGKITLKKKEKGISWGGAYWQYTEDISKIKPHTQSPLKLDKKIFVQRHTKSGPVIKPFEGEELHIGDLIIVRVILKSDRDMEYVHLKDQRPSGFEPTNVLSGYKNQDGLWYYESTKDTATHFFIDYLHKGTYVFEYSLRVVNSGRYQSGIATIQCMYAPEFSSHSGSILLEVK